MTDWPATQSFELVQHEYLALSAPVQIDEDEDLQVTGDLCLTLWL